MRGAGAQNLSDPPARIPYPIKRPKYNGGVAGGCVGFLTPTAGRPLCQDILLCATGGQPRRALHDWQAPLWCKG